MGKTSSISKQRYNDKTYSQVAVRLEKDLVSAWEEKIKAQNIGKAEFIRRAIKAYLAE